jgi:hypothetical protein
MALRLAPRGPFGTEAADPGFSVTDKSPVGCARRLAMKFAVKRREAALDIYNAILGSFLFVSPWLFAFGGGPAREGAFVAGAVVVLVSMLAIAAFAEWEEWINLAIGCWLLASPFVLHFPHKTGMHVTIAVGATVTFLSLLELWLVHNPGWIEQGTAPDRRQDRQTGGR